MKWVLEQQRQEVSQQIPGLVAEDLRQVLQEAALCVVQSGNETAKLAMLKSRFMDDANPVADLLKRAQTETERTEDKALNNLLTAFYLKPGEGDKTGSVEFAHKSFGEFLFAERLKVAFEDWTELDPRQRPRLNDAAVARQIYDLLGYGPLTVEIVDYLKELLFSAEEGDDLARLSHRLHQFYDSWCEGFYIDKVPGDNLPQSKMMQLNAAEIATGVRQVDIHAGLNVMILLFEMHRYGQQQDDETSRWALHFHPCGDLKTGVLDREKLLRIIGYSQLIRLHRFVATVGRHLSDANLSDANLSDANLSFANLSQADLRAANLSHAALRAANLIAANLIAADLRYADLCAASLSHANLSSANLSHANLIAADLSSADLRAANLSYTNLENILFDEETNWADAKGLETAKNLPEALKQQLGLS
ncbi:MAG: hypothetical protein DCF15_16380 [Phormidesmis priestleyi]|uniref:Low-complexity protein n=1 Tax=Phormidesmis priestleyi TaxID=268141 RepID=A0A2W4YUT2_9CYAN|nr:MAG: hypothetical protein DCF15_16380 [Phormidesmis priestleyi]